MPQIKCFACEDKKEWTDPDNEGFHHRKTILQSNVTRFTKCTQVPDGSVESLPLVEVLKFDETKDEWVWVPKTASDQCFYIKNGDLYFSYLTEGPVYKTKDKARVFTSREKAQNLQNSFKDGSEVVQETLSASRE